MLLKSQFRLETMEMLKVVADARTLDRHEVRYFKNSTPIKILQENEHSALLMSDHMKNHLLLT